MQNIQNRIAKLETEIKPEPPHEFIDWCAYTYLYQLCLSGSVDGEPKEQPPYSEEQFDEMLTSGRWLTPEHQTQWLYYPDGFKRLLYDEFSDCRLTPFMQAEALRASFKGVNLSRFPISGQESHIDDFIKAVAAWFDTERLRLRDSTLSIVG